MEHSENEVEKKELPLLEKLYNWYLERMNEKME